MNHFYFFVTHHTHNHLPIHPHTQTHTLSLSFSLHSISFTTFSGYQSLLHRVVTDLTSRTAFLEDDRGCFWSICFLLLKFFLEKRKSSRVEKFSTLLEKVVLEIACELLTVGEACGKYFTRSVFVAL